MAPLIETFHAARLQQYVQYGLDGKPRKPPVDLLQCELKEMVQYHCDLVGPRRDPRSKIVCEPVLRLFRKCADGLLVETTAWEGIHGR